MQKKMVGCLFLLLAASCSRNTAAPPLTSDSGPRELTFLPTAETNSEAPSFLRIVADFKQRTGLTVVSLPVYHSVEARRRHLQQLFAARSPQPDLLEIDNIWTPALGPDMLDLQTALAEDIKDIPDDLLAPFTLHGKVVAMPLFLSTSVLYYRTDLLRKYGYAEPPESWSELKQMASVIQSGERKRGNAGFWGFIWQGAQGEALTCNALEWQRSEGGGIFNQHGAVSVATPEAEAALLRARSWVGAISPPAVTGYDELDADNLWLAGLAAFDRSWLSLYTASQAGSATAGKFSTAPLPAGSQQRAWMFGGVGIGVSRFSTHKTEALVFIHDMLSRETQRRRLLTSAIIPVRTSLLNDPNLLQRTSLSGWMGQHWREGIFSRPSTAAGVKYEAVSAAYSEAVHDIISGKRGAHERLAALQTKLTDIMRH